MENDENGSQEPSTNVRKEYSSTLLHDELFGDFASIPPDTPDIFGYLSDHERELCEALMSGGENDLRAILDAALKDAAEDMLERIERAERNRGEILKAFQNIFGKVVADVPEVDRIIETVPEIARDGMTLAVRGKLGIYRISLWNGSTEATCFQGHLKPLSICIEANGDVQKIGQQWSLSMRSKMVLQMALSLIDETELDDVIFYRDMNAIVMCPRCYQEGTISDEALEAMMEIRKKGGELDEFVVL